MILSANENQLEKYKSTTLDYLPKEYVIKYVVSKDNNRLIDNIKKSGLKFPLILKPNWCGLQGNNVYKANNLEEAINIKAKLPYDNIIIQEYDDSPYEGTILYERYPFCENGEIMSMVRKIPIKKDTLIHNYKNSTFANITKTPQLEKIIDTITKRIPNFYVGRYDIKYRSEEELLKGKFKIIELNGVFGMDQGMYVKQKSLININNLYDNVRFLAKRTFIGILNNLNPVTFARNLIVNTSATIDIIKCPITRHDFMKAFGLLSIVFFVVYNILKFVRYYHQKI